MSEFNRVTKNDYYFVEDVEKHFPLLDMMKKTKFFNELSNVLHVTIEDLYHVVNELQIPHKSMFSYEKGTFVSKDNGFPILLEENTYYKWVEKDGYAQKKYVNTYLVENQFITLLAEKIIFCILSRQFKDFFDNELMCKIVRKYPSDLNITPSMQISDIPFELSHLTCADIANLLINKDAANDIKRVTKCHIYGSNLSCFYVELPSIIVHGVEYTKSLTIPYESLYNGDWGMVENVNIISDIYPNANEKLGQDYNNWYHGKQKDAPLFQMDEVKQIEELFKRTIVRGN